MQSSSQYYLLGDWISHMYKNCCPAGDKEILAKSRWVLLVFSKNMLSDTKAFTQTFYHGGTGTFSS